MIDLKAAEDFARIYSYSLDSDPAASAWIDDLVAECRRLEKAMYDENRQANEARRQLAIANGLIKELRVDLTVARDALEHYEGLGALAGEVAREALAKIGGTDA